MKNTIIYLLLGLMVALSLGSCSPEKFAGAVQSEIPTVEGLDFTLEVDQETNQITASVPEREGYYPVWIINGATYSTLSTVRWSNKNSGTYGIELRMGNRNGLSHASVKKSFTFDRTLVDWGPYFNRLNGKEWRVMSEEPGHLACGTPGGSGSDWWSAMPGDKEDLGLYDDRVTFTFDKKGSNTGTYSYHPGEGGTMYVNKDCTTVYPEQKGNATEDYMAQVEPVETTFTLEPGVWTDSEGKEQECVYLVLPAHTPFPYIASDQQWTSPRLRIEQVTAKRIDLVADGAEISWHIVLSSEAPDAGGEDENAFKGYKYDSDCNLWPAMTYEVETYYAPGWVVSADPIGIKSESNREIELTLPAATNERWQAQVKLHTTLATKPDINYDFSAILTSSEKILGATIKLVKTGDDGNFFFEERVDLTPDEPYYFYKDDMAGIDMEAVTLVLDFGGAPAGTVVKLQDVVLKDHSCDDGSGHPVDATPYPYDTEDNLWKSVDAGDPELFFFYADANYNPYPEEPGFENEGNKYTVTLPLPTVQQWQAQVSLQTMLSCKKDEVYDFGCIVKSNVDLPSVTIKLVKYGGGDNDNVYFFVKQFTFAADEETVVKIPASTSPDDMDRISLFFDFGGNPEGTVVEIKDIVFQKSH